MRIVVAGGGLGGLSCAKSLVEAGHTVTVVEGQPFLGGRAATWRDEDGDLVEQGLHLFWGAYSELRALLRDIGKDPAEVLAWSTQLRFQDPEGPTEATFSIDPLRAPGATLASVLGHRDYLAPKDKLALLAPRRKSPQTVAQRWGGHEMLMHRLLGPLCRCLQASEPEQVAAADMLAWMQQIARHPTHAHVAGWRGARGDTIFGPLAAWLTTYGVEILLRRPVAGLATGEQVEALELRNGERIEGDVFVMAVPAWELLPLLPEQLRQMDFFQEIDALPTVPALSVQLWFDGDRVSSKEYTLVAGSRAAIYQDQSTTAYPDPRGSRLSVNVCPADELLGASDAQILAGVMDTLGAVEPGLRGAEPRKVVILRHPHHQLRPLPGVLARRPPQRTPVPNLFLAGDWTRQEFPSCQEGAVRGGKRCAEAICAAYGSRLYRTA